MEIVTLRIDEDYLNVVEKMAEEEFFDSKSEGIRYALDRKLEQQDSSYNPVTEENEEINKRFRELGKEYGIQEEFPYVLEDKRIQDSFELAEKALEKAEEYEDEELRDMASDYLHQHFDFES